MFRNYRLSRSLKLPKSFPGHYYFDPNLITVGLKKFDTNMTGRTITREEYLNLRKRIREIGGCMLKMASLFFYLRFIVFLLTLAYFILRIVLYYTNNWPLNRISLLELAAAVILPNIFTILMWRITCSKSYARVQGFLEDENKHTYAKRSVAWKISENLYYMHVAIFKKIEYYMPPKIMEEHKVYDEHRQDLP